MILKDFLFYSIINEKYIEINIAELFLFATVILFGILLHNKLRKVLCNLLNKITENKEITKLSRRIISIVLWSIFANLIILFVVNDSLKLIIFSNEYFLINLFRILLSVSILAIAISFQKYLNSILEVKKSENKEEAFFSQFFLSFFIWLATLYLVIRISLANFKKVSAYTLLSIMDVDISVFDILHILITIIIVGIILSAIKKIFRLQTKKKRLDIGTSTALYKVTKYIILIFTFLIVLQNIGFQLSILLAGSAALLVGLGMGMQQIFSDVASGLLLLIERTLKINDIIEVDKIVGKVVKTSIRTTTVVTRDNIRIIVPNTKFTSNNVINWSHVEKNTRFHINIGVAYGSDVQLIIKILEKCANSNNEISKQEKPFVRFNDFGESSLDFQLYFWTNNSFEVEHIKSDLRIAIDKEFREKKIVIPFPQRDIHIIKQ